MVIPTYDGQQTTAGSNERQTFPRPHPTSATAAQYNLQQQRRQEQQQRLLEQQQRLQEQQQRQEQEPQYVQEWEQQRQDDMEEDETDGTITDRVAEEGRGHDT